MLMTSKLMKIFVKYYSNKRNFFEMSRMVEISFSRCANQARIRWDLTSQTKYTRDLIKKFGKKE